MIKVTGKTNLLCILFLITLIANLIYKPCDNFLEKFCEANGHSAFLFEIIISIFLPLESELIGIADCFLPFLLEDGGNMSIAYAFALVLKIPVYVILTHQIQKYQSKISQTEDFRTVFITIHCLEGITVYILNIVFHILGKIFEISQNDNVFQILIVPIGIVAAFIGYFSMLYIAIGILINVIPIAGIFIWKKFSDKIYNFLINLKIADFDIFKIPRIILEKTDDFLDIFS